MTTEPQPKPAKEVARRKIIITSILSPDGKPEPFGNRGATKIRFKAKDGDTEYTYDTIHKSLFQYIVVTGEIIDADIEKRTNAGQDGNVYVNRSLIQIYKDGQPLSDSSKKGGSNWNSPGHDASQEKIAAYNGIMALLVQKIIPIESDLGKLATTWATATLSAGPTQPTSESVRAPQSGTVPAPKSGVDEIDWEGEKHAVGEPKNMGEFLAWVSSHDSKKYTRTWLFKTIGVTEAEIQANPAKVKDAFYEVKKMMDW
jgi:hypothetical protein